jgi:hypothetical protein
MYKTLVIVGIAVISLCALSVNASIPVYPVSSIPKELLKDANAIIRFSDEKFEVFSDKRATLKKAYAITILKKEALDMADLELFYDEFSSISAIEVTVYDEFGNKVKKIPNADIIDYNTCSGFSLYESNHVKVVDTKYQTLPFTVEVSYTINHLGLLSFPSWVPHVSFNVGVEWSKYTVTIPEAMTIRLKEQNLGATTNITHEKGFKNYVWELSNLKALKDEPYSPPIMQYAPAVFSAPSDFKIDGYKGNADSWENLGKWDYSLLEGRDILSAESSDSIKSLVSNCKTDKDKVMVIYKYLQENTRYVSIQIGIGGWQPYEAEKVNRLKYGDCKALSIYMKAMLKAVGIHSIYVLVNAGYFEAAMMKDFPSNQFNHAFLCVPIENDTIWLECTDPYATPGYLGTFTDDRDVLLVTPEGGKVVHTPSYSGFDNLQLYTANVTIDESGNALCTMNNSFYGLHHAKSSYLIHTDKEDQKKKLYNRIAIPNFEIKDFKETEVKGKIPAIQEELILTLKNYGTIMGNRLIIPLNLLNKESLIPRDRDKRISDIYLPREILEIDTIHYYIPAGYKIESISQNGELINEFGNYKCIVAVKGNEITYIRRHFKNKGTFDKTKYNEFYTYAEKLNIMDNAKVVLIKAE